MKIFLNSICFIFIVYQSYSQNNFSPLYKIVDNNKVGFINNKAQVSIKPIYYAANDFSEGFAATRLKGLYGFINGTGDFIISPRYDYATEFNNGHAVVYLNGKPMVIDKKGNLIVDTIYQTISKFNNSRAYVTSKSNNFGVINTEGKLVIDTNYTLINPFAEGYAVVLKMVTIGSDADASYGVIDSFGKVIIPLGIYKKINDCVNGYFRVTTMAESDSTEEGSSKIGLVDTKGKLLFKKRFNSREWIDGHFNCGLAKINLYNSKAFGASDNVYESKYTYAGYVNTLGEIVINNKDYKHAHDFNSSRAFIQNENREYSIINREGKIISDKKFNDVIGDKFNNGLAIVKTNHKWGIVDTNANYVMQPKFTNIDNVGIVNGYIFFSEDSEMDYDDEGRPTGIAKIDGGVILSPKMNSFERNGFVNGLIKCIIGKKLTYINKSGAIVWQEKINTEHGLSFLNIDMMNRGYFYAYSEESKDDAGGFGGSNNSPKKVSNNSFPKNKLSIEVSSNTVDTFNRIYKGRSVYLYNTTNDTIVFNAQDSRLYMKVQAKTIKGEWKDIEYLPSSWCGNSYHTLQLYPSYFWKFVTPIYDGSIKTKLRIELKYVDHKDKNPDIWERKEITIYSNEYDGSINPSQFWRQSTYYANGIMDPYNE